MRWRPLLLVSTASAPEPGCARRGSSEPDLRLDLLRTTTAPAEGSPGTPAGEPGVLPGVRPREATPAIRPVSRAGWREWLLVFAVSFTLLGQGERAHVDPRFRSPSMTLLTYWEALRQGDAAGAFECYVEGRNDLPLPGQLWFLPPTDDLWLEGWRLSGATGGRVELTYEVHYIPTGLDEERLFRTGNELVRMRGEWRIVRPLGEASMPEWKPVPGPVDI